MKVQNKDQARHVPKMEDKGDNTQDSKTQLFLNLEQIHAEFCYDHAAWPIRGTLLFRPK